MSSCAGSTSEPRAVATGQGDKSTRCSSIPTFRKLNIWPVATASGSDAANCASVSRSAGAFENFSDSQQIIGAVPVTARFLHLLAFLPASRSPRFNTLLTSLFPVVYFNWRLFGSLFNFYRFYSARARRSGFCGGRWSGEKRQLFSLRRRLRFGHWVDDFRRRQGFSGSYAFDPGNRGVQHRSRLFLTTLLVNQGASKRANQK